MKHHKYTPEEKLRIEELARKNNVSAQTIKVRLRINCYDFSKVDFPNSILRLKYYINGVPAVRIAKENGITQARFHLRLKYGWPLEKACTYNEPSTKEIARKTGLSVNRVNYLLKTHTRQELING